jgi:hypothetical protein
MAAVGTKKAIPAKNEPKCKLCRHDRREHIDQLLLARSMRQTDPATGQQINLQYVLDALRGLGVENPTEENIKVHFRRHVEVVDSAAADEMDKASEELFAELIEQAPAHLTAANVAEWQIKLWMARELARLRSGEGPSITTDQAQQAQRILVQSRQNEAQEKLLGGMVGVLGAALRDRKQIESKPLEIEAEPVEEAEVVG